MPGIEWPLRIWIGALLVGGMLCGTAWSQDEAAPKVDEAEAKAAAKEHDTHDHAAGEQHAEHQSIGKDMTFFAVVPFGLLLLCIAVLPLATPHWWEHNHNKGIVAALLAVPVAAYLYFMFGHTGLEKLEHSALEYASFILLLGSLYVISGGVLVKGSLAGTPIVNTFVLSIGAVIASFVGTTGASVLLIRPLLRANAPRQNKAHVVVFFIFIVSNCGGLLTPLGDPPLFLGFLKGVPFMWTFSLWPQWLLVNGLLLVIFNIYDQVVFNREEVERPGSQLEEVTHHEPLRLSGLQNFAYLGAIIAIIAASGSGIGNGGKPWPFGISELAMLGTAMLAYFTTSSEIRAKNRFTFTPIIEVAVLFAGIFVTMIPALQMLNAHGSELGIEAPWQFFWATGVLSSFLDNAPTYLTFAATAAGMKGIELEGAYIGEFLNHGAEAAKILAAISCAAVFMGANTYIGNGPNFMVKAIAEENGVKMPSFFGYMIYSGAILVPIFVIVTFVFFK